MYNIIKDLNAYIFVSLIVIALVFFSWCIPAMLTVASTAVNICAIFMIAFAVYTVVEFVKAVKYKIDKSTSENKL